MNIKKTLMSALLMLGFISASAQEQEPKMVYDFYPHWYVQVQPLGIQYTLGEADFGDLTSYNAQVGVGYQFNPIVGARLAINAWQSKGASEYTKLVGNPKAWKDFDYKWKWNYVAPTVDATFNLTNLFLGYDPTRLFNFSVFAGLGANIGFSNGEAADVQKQIISDLGQTANVNDRNVPLDDCWTGTKVRLVGQAGIAGDFRISDAISVGLELGANTLSDAYNSKHAGNWDWYFNGNVGVKIALGQTYSSHVAEAPKPVERIVEKVVEKVVEKPAQVIAPAQFSEPTNTNAAEEVDAREPLRRDIFFTINSTKITNDELTKVKEIADYLKKYPDAKVVITGYADKGTGSAAINARLAKSRAQIVVNTLIQKYRIARNRITSDSKGDTVQPFAENDKNRVSVAIAE